MQHDLLVYVGDPLPSSWTRLCVRQADLVLLVGRGAAGTLEPGLLETIGPAGGPAGARRELVLLYDSGQRMPCGTADWLARVPVSAHHHVDPRLPRDYDRLARMLTGRAVGLVLGGGGARALAHIGVIRALEEAGIPIDLVGGTSSGAIIGGQCASGWESARILAQSRKVLIDHGSLNDFTLPVIALRRGRRYIRMLESLFADGRIEDLPLSFFCVSTNLTRSTCMVHRAGLLSEKVGASGAVPGLSPPTADGRDILVDGGVLNNLPVDVLLDGRTDRVGDGQQQLHAPDRARDRERLTELDPLSECRICRRCPERHRFGGRHVGHEAQQQPGDGHEQRGAGGASLPPCQPGHPQDAQPFWPARAARPGQRPPGP